MGHDKCPNCGAELEDFIYKEDGEEFPAKKCSRKNCTWWGSA